MGRERGRGEDTIHLRDCHVTLPSHKSGRFRWELEMAKCGGVLEKKKKALCAFRIRTLENLGKKEYISSVCSNFFLNNF